MTLIGLCGAAGAGKGAVADRLVKEHGFLELAFADPLYKAVSAIVGEPIEWLKDRRNKEAVIPWIGKSPRELLQTLGTEWGRGLVSDTIWIDRAMQAVRRASGPGVVITDVRFDNEAEAIRAEGGVVIEVARPYHKCLLGDAATHPSEAGISREHIVATLVNGSTIAALRNGVDSIIRYLHADIL